MAFSGGTFSRTFDCTTDRDNGVKILASKFDTELDGMAVGLSTAILKDGTQTCTAAIPFAQGITLPDNKTIAFGTNTDVLIQYDETTTDSLKISAAEGAGLAITLMADEGDDAGDEWKLNIADGGTLTLGNDINSAGTYVTHLTITPNATVANSTTAVAGNLTVGGDLTLGSGAVISEAELEMLDGITAGTVAASKAVVVDANKDIGSFRNITLTGELDAGSLDVSGDADIDGTLETDALSINGTAVSSTAAELNYNDTGAAVGTVVASKTVTVDANKDVSSFRNITLTGELDAGSLDVSGNADIDGTLEADAITINGTAINSIFQPLDVQLTDVAGLAVTDGNFIVGDGSNFVAESGATARTSLGLGSIATQAANSVDIDGGAVDGVTIGTNSAVTDLRVDNLKLDGNTISSTNSNGAITIDPNGTGNVALGNFTFDADQTVGSSQDNYVLTYDHSSTSISLEASAGGGGGATGGGSDEIFYENGQNVTTDYTITNGKNAMSAGPITINSGVTVTVGSGETWTVV